MVRYHLQSRSLGRLKLKFATNRSFPLSHDAVLMLYLIEFKRELKPKTHSNNARGPEDDQPGAWRIK